MDRYAEYFYDLLLLDFWVQYNLRKLFARTFYGIDKDIASLADIPGHSFINTIRIYIMTTGYEHRRKIERLGLVV